MAIDFKAEISIIGWAAVHRGGGNPGKSPKDAAERCAKIYANTQMNPHSVILIGPDQLRKNSELKEKFGLITAGKKTGAILGELQWSTLINDVFMLASIEGQKEVRLYWPSGKITEDKLCRNEKLTSMGRELAILMKMGYQRAHTHDGKAYLAFTPPNTIQQVALSAMWTSLEDIKTSTELLKFILAG